MRQSNGQEPVKLHCTVERETERAVLINYEGQETWLPKSQIEFDAEQDGSAVVVIPGWLADKKRLI